MKYFILLVLVLLIPFGNTTAQSKVLKPVNIKTKTLISVSGKSRAYYPLDAVKENILQISGPGKLKLLIRPRFTSEKQKTIDYSIFYRIDGAGRIESKVKNNKRSENSKYKNAAAGVPGEDQIITIYLSDGEHTIQIWGGNNKIKADARYLFTPAKQKKMKWVSLTPSMPNEPVNLIYGEEVVNYYRFSDSKPLRIKITGPTKLRVLTRVENHYNMKGRIFYRLKVNEDGKLKNTFQLNSIRSESSFYEKDPKRVPGRAKEIVIEVPAGIHSYEIIPLDKDKGTLLGKVLFPKKDMKLGE